MHAPIATPGSPAPAAYHGHVAPTDCYRIWAEGPVLRIDGRGDWNQAVARAYVADVKRAIADMRAHYPHLRAIVDRSSTPTYGPGVRELLLAAYADLLRAGDRIAMVVATSLDKGMVRQLAAREETQSFLSITAARTWVLAYG